MGARNLMILFFSTMVISLVLLIVFFNLFFKNIDVTVETKMPESAPTAKDYYDVEVREDGDIIDGAKQSDNSFKASGILQARLNVPAAAPKTLVDENDPDVVRNEDGESTVRLSPSNDPAAMNQDFPPWAGYANPNASGPLMAPDPIDNSGQVAPAAPMPKPKSKPKSSSLPDAEDNVLLYQVYLDGFNSLDNAKTQANALKQRGIDAFVNQSEGRPIVKIGTYMNRSTASAIADKTGAKIKTLK